MVIVFVLTSEILGELVVIFVVVEDNLVIVANLVVEDVLVVEEMEGQRINKIQGLTATAGRSGHTRNRCPKSYGRTSHVSSFAHVAHAYEEQVLKL